MNNISNIDPVMSMAPWEVDMGSITSFDLAARIARRDKQEEGLHAPMVIMGSLLRPALISDLRECVRVPARVGVNKYVNGTFIVGLEFSKEIEGIGRPVFGLDSDKNVQGDFGDPESVDGGYCRFELIVRGCGAATLSAERARGGLRVLSGITNYEALAFAVGCTSAIDAHYNNMRRAKKQTS